MKKALVKKTGEIFDIVSEYSTFKLPIDFPDKVFLENKITKTWSYEGDQVKMRTGKEREDYYVLSNGETYEVDDLAVGLDEIRDWKLKMGLNI